MGKLSILGAPGQAVQLVQRAIRGVGELVQPGICAACGADAEDGILCLACWQDLRESLVTEYCRGCGHGVGLYALVDGRCYLCRSSRPALARVVRIGPYDGPLRSLVLGLKFGGKSHVDALLGKLLAAAAIGDPELASVDAFVPVPLHWRRRWRRGYNQAELLAVATARRLGRPVPVQRALVRVRHTPPQTTLSESQRLRNLRGAFAVPRWARSRLAGRHVCLIDDVTTTGTTLRMAARTLKKAGAARVSALVVAAGGH